MTISTEFGAATPALIQRVCSDYSITDDGELDLTEFLTILQVARKRGWGVSGKKRGSGALSPSSILRKLGSIRPPITSTNSAEPNATRDDAETTVEVKDIRRCPKTFHRWHGWREKLHTLVTATWFEGVILCAVVGNTVVLAMDKVRHMLPEQRQISTFGISHFVLLVLLVFSTLKASAEFVLWKSSTSFLQLYLLLRWR